LLYNISTISGDSKLKGREIGKNKNIVKSLKLGNTNTLIYIKSQQIHFNKHSNQGHAIVYINTTKKGEEHSI